MIFDGFIGPSYTVRSVNADCERSVNLYPEILESDGKKSRMVLYGVPGNAAFTTLPASPCRPLGLFAQDMRVFAVAGDRLFELFADGTAIDRGGLANDGLPVSIYSNGLGGNQLFIVSGGLGYIFSLTANTLTQITVAGFPANAAMGAFFDQYFFVHAKNTASFQISGLSTGSTWAAGDIAQRSAASDNISAILRVGRFLWLLGTRTSEVWYNSGAASFPFAPVPGVLIETGCAASFSPTLVAGSPTWLSQNAEGARMVVMADGYTPQRISTHAVELALNSYSTVSDAVGYSYQDEGHTFYVLTFPTANATWVFDAATKFWHERGKWPDGTTDYEAQRAISHCYGFGQHLVGDRSSGIVYTQSLGTYADGATKLRWLRRTPHLCQEQVRTYHHRLQVDMETGVGLNSGQGSAPVLSARWSNDGGHTYSNWADMNLGAMGQYAARAYLMRLGMARDRVYEVTGSDPVKTALIAAYLDVTAGLA